jgi:hypothetical protein
VDQAECRRDDGFARGKHRPQRVKGGERDRHGDRHFDEARGQAQRAEDAQGQRQRVAKGEGGNDAEPAAGMLRVMSGGKMLAFSSQRSWAIAAEKN